MDDLVEQGALLAVDGRGPEFRFYGCHIAVTVFDYPAIIRQHGCKTAFGKVKDVAPFFQIGKTALDKKELTNLDSYVKNTLEVDKEKAVTL